MEGRAAEGGGKWEGGNHTPVLNFTNHVSCVSVSGGRDTKVEK